MNRNQFDKTERREVTTEDVEAALETVFLAPKSRTKRENREPTKAELDQKWRMDRLCDLDTAAPYGPVNDTE